MRITVRGWRAPVAVFFALLLLTGRQAPAFQVRQKASRFDAIAVTDPSLSIDVVATPVASLPATEKLRGAWEAFRAVAGQSWSIYIDRRSGAPLLVEGQGIPWPISLGATVESIAASLRTFVSAKRALLLADDAELVLDREASGSLSPDVWQIVFGHAVLGVPVAGERYVFYVGHGNLISFGATRWSRVTKSPVPDNDATEALVRMAAAMGLTKTDGITIVNE